MGHFVALGRRGDSMVLARFRMPVLAVTIGAAALALPLSLAVPAQAAAGRNARPGAPSVINSQVIAGYQAKVALGSATSLAARFKVPRLSCTAAYRAIAPEAAVNVNNNRSDSSAFVFVGCQRGRAVYAPALVLNGNLVYYTTRVGAGDVIKLSVKVTTRGTTVQVTDVTTGFTKTRTGPGARPGAFFVGDAAVTLNGLTPIGVPGFGTLTFTGCLVDGRALARSHPARYQRVNSRGLLQIATGALSPGGTAFATHYRHS